MINESLIEVYVDLIQKKTINLFTRKPWSLSDVPSELAPFVEEKLKGGIQNG